MVEQERQLRQAMTNRAGVLGLMLHSTFDHAYAEKMQKHNDSLKEQNAMENSEANNQSFSPQESTSTITATTPTTTTGGVLSSQTPQSVTSEDPQQTPSSVGSKPTPNKKEHRDHGYFATKTPHDRKDDHIYFNKKI